MKRIIYRYKFLGLTVKNEMVLLPDGKTVQMALTQGQFCLFDILDLKYVIGFRWYAAKRKNTFYAATNVRLDNGKKTLLLMHKQIMSPESDLVVDHIDGNGLNNTRKNLRICSQSENTRNRSAQTNNKLGVKGVSLHDCGKFQANIQINGKLFHLGYYENKDHAALAYNTAAEIFFGNFAVLNELPENTYLSKHESKILYKQINKIRNFLREDPSENDSNIQNEESIDLEDFLN